MAIEREAKLCPDPIRVQPCPACGAAAKIIRVNGDRVTVERICCTVSSRWLSAEAMAWFASMGLPRFRAEAVRA